MRPASHTIALGSLFISSDPEKCKRESIFWHESLPGWFHTLVSTQKMMTLRFGGPTGTQGRSTARDDIVRRLATAAARYAWAAGQPRRLPLHGLILFPALTEHSSLQYVQGHFHPEDFSTKGIGGKRAFYTLAIAQRQA